jgi:hypothetical protein
VRRCRNSVDSCRTSKPRPSTDSNASHRHRPHTDRSYRHPPCPASHRFGRRSNGPRPLPFRHGPTRRRSFHANHPGVRHLNSRARHHENQDGRPRRSDVRHPIRNSIDSSRRSPDVPHPNATLCIHRNPIALRHHQPSRRHFPAGCSLAVCWPGARPRRNSAAQNSCRSGASRRDVHRKSSTLSSRRWDCCLRDRPKGHRSAGGEIGRQAWQTMLRHACRIRAVGSGSFPRTAIRHMVVIGCSPRQYQPTGKRQRAPTRRSTLFVSINSGGVLLSQGVYPQVPSALTGLTSVFEMGTGVTLSLRPPETCCQRVCTLQDSRASTSESLVRIQALGRLVPVS